MTSPVGLCQTCVHARTVASAKGSVFWLCRLSESDPRFPRYPPLPVLACAGYERSSDGAKHERVDEHDA